MLKYNCKLCNFSTNNKTDYKRHLKTKKHQANVEASIPENSCSESSEKKVKQSSTIAPENARMRQKNVFECQYCKITFTRSNGLIKHTNKCVRRIDARKEKDLEVKLKEKDRIIREKNKQMEKLERDKEYYKKLIDSYSTMGTKNFNSITYILNSYPNAPHIETIEPKKLKQFKDIDVDNVRDIISDYRNNRLVDRIIETIVYVHKKKDPSEQSIWATDSSRHNYIIKELIKDEDSYWIVDKKGIKSENYIIKPILSFIREKVMEYLDIAGELLADPKITSFKRDAIIDSQSYGSELIKDIDDNAMSKEIIKKLAKHIHHYGKAKVEEIE